MGERRLTGCTEASTDVFAANNRSHHIIARTVTCMTEERADAEQKIERSVALVDGSHTLEQSGEVASRISSQ